MKNFFLPPVKLDFEITELLLIILVFMMCLACIKLIFSKKLVVSIITMSLFSSFIAVCYLLLDAPDVAMTEAALGVCLSTCVLLNIAKIIKEDGENISKWKIFFASILCIIFILSLVLGAYSLPVFGSNNSPIQDNLTKYYIENTQSDIAIPSMVAAILASYRGYDTLGETIVILIAGLGVIVIKSRRKQNDT